MSWISSRQLATCQRSTGVHTAESVGKVEEKGRRGWGVGVGEGERAREQKGGISKERDESGIEGMQLIFITSVWDIHFLK